MLRDGYRHEGIELGFGGEGHRIDFEDLVGAAVQLYPQTDVFIDLADARERDGGDVRFGVSDVSVVDVTTDRPGILFTDARAPRRRSGATTSSASDGSRSICRHEFPEAQRRQFFREYPFAWFGILCEAPPSAPELIYNHSDRGFALISQRTETLQRMYFQCDPTEDVDDWSDDRIWEELQARVGANGYTLKEGPITSKTVLPFRSFVQEPMRHGNLLLAGDAAHTVPPTGAKGLNLALADVRVLAEELERAVTKQRRLAAGRLHRAGAGPGVEGAALLLLDDHDAAPAPRGQPLRRTPPGRRALHGRLLDGGLDLPRRGLHGLAGRLTG